MIFPDRNNQILLMADEDENDRIFVETALVGSTVELVTVCNGVELMNYLYGRGIYSGKDNQPPDLILLDIDTAEVSAQKALKKIKADPNLRAIPVIVLSEEHDAHQCYQLGANCYVPKPMNFEDLIQVLEAFRLYWSDVEMIRPETHDTSRKEQKTQSMMRGLNMPFGATGGTRARLNSKPLGRSSMGKKPPKVAV